MQLTGLASASKGTPPCTCGHTGPLRWRRNGAASARTRARPDARAAPAQRCTTKQVRRGSAARSSARPRRATPRQPLRSSAVRLDAQCAASASTARSVTPRRPCSESSCRPGQPAASAATPASVTCTHLRGARASAHARRYVLRAARLSLARQRPSNGARGLPAGADCRAVTPGTLCRRGGKVSISGSLSWQPQRWSRAWYALAGPAHAPGQVEGGQLVAPARQRLHARVCACAPGPCHRAACGRLSEVPAAVARADTARPLALLAGKARGCWLGSRHEQRTRNKQLPAAARAAHAQLAAASKALRYTRVSMETLPNAYLSRGARRRCPAGAARAAPPAPPARRRRRPRTRMRAARADGRNAAPARHTRPA